MRRESTERGRLKELAESVLQWLENMDDEFAKKDLMKRRAIQPPSFIGLVEAFVRLSEDRAFKVKLTWLSVVIGLSIAVIQAVDIFGLFERTLQSQAWSTFLWRAFGLCALLGMIVTNVFVLLRYPSGVPKR